jgi:hypothetical protein
MTGVRCLAALATVAITAGFSAPRVDSALAVRGHLARIHVSRAHAPVARAQSASTRFNDCWASPELPSHNGGNVQASLTWQCNGWPQQMQIYVTLTSVNWGTRYSASATCYNTNNCSVPVSGPWVSGDYSDSWTLRAEYIYVVQNNVSHYEFGPYWTVNLN